MPSGACASLAGYLWLIQTHARTHPRTQARTHHCGQPTGSAGLAYMAAWAHNSQLACQLANSHVKSPANLHTEIKLHMAQDPLHMTQDPLHAAPPPAPKVRKTSDHTRHIAYESSAVAGACGGGESQGPWSPGLARCHTLDLPAAARTTICLLVLDSVTTYVVK